MPPQPRLLLVLLLYVVSRDGGGAIGFRGTPDDSPAFDDIDDGDFRLSDSCPRISTLIAHARVSRSATDGGGVSLGQCGRNGLGGDGASDPTVPSSPPTRATSGVSSERTNRKAAIVASKRGRASMGLQVRIFRRSLSRRVNVCEGRGLDGFAGAVGGREGSVIRRVVEVVVNVKDRVRREGEGVVTTHKIVLRSAGVGGSEKLAFKLIAICDKGRRQTEVAVAKIEARQRSVTWEKIADTRGSDGCDRAAVQAAEASAV